MIRLHNTGHGVYLVLGQSFPVKSQLAALGCEFDKEGKVWFCRAPQAEAVTDFCSEQNDRECVLAVQQWLYGKPDSKAETGKSASQLALEAAKAEAKESGRYVPERFSAETQKTLSMVAAAKEALRK